MKVSRTVYTHPVEPEKYPSYMRRSAKAVTRPQLGNQIRFMALRWFDTDEKGNFRTLDPQELVMTPFSFSNSLITQN